MKKLSICLIVIAILALAIVPTVAFAESDWSNPNLRLINPVAITTIGNKLFVADNVDLEENKGVVLAFDISSSPKYLYTFTTEKLIQNIAEINGELCIIYVDCVETYNVSQSTLSKVEGKTYTMENVKDLTVGKYNLDSIFDGIYTIDNEGLSFLYYSQDTLKKRPIDGETPQACAALYVDNIGDSAFDGYVYCVFNSGVKRFNGLKGMWDNREDDFNKLGIYSPNFSPMGIFSYKLGDNRQIALYNENQIHILQKRHWGPIDGHEWEYAATEVLNLDRADTDGKIVNVSYTNDKIFILDSNNQVEIYSYDAETVGFVRDSATIGTDTITLGTELPTRFTGFTLAKSLGYPTNIVYKTTNPESSIDEILTDYNQEVIILHFDGCEDLGFYYVLVGDKYGWIKKSDGVTKPQDDDKIHIVPTAASPVPDVKQMAKFTSLHAVSIYQLPRSESEIIDKFIQSIDNPQSAEILQKFYETQSDGTVTEWYYVSYGEDKFGFIQSGNVGQFYSATTLGEGQPVEGYRKINSSLFEAVKLYLTSDMKENEVICNENGDVVKLYSSSRVVAIREEGDATFVEIRQSNGNTSYGWIASENLIDRHGITTNAIVGLSILGVAIVATAIFALVFFKRKVKMPEQDQTDDFTI